MEVYSPNGLQLLVVPHTDVHYVPLAGQQQQQQQPGAKPLTLCEMYNPNHGVFSCSNGFECAYVHATTANAAPARRPVEDPGHVNFAWRSLDEVAYRRAQPGRMLHVSLPNERNATDVISSALVLQTRAVAVGRPRLCHCAHYYYTRECHLGADCTFVHAVYLDSGAADGQRAPVPASLPGRPSPATTRRRKQQWEDHRDQRPVGKKAPKAARQQQQECNTAAVLTRRVSDSEPACFAGGSFSDADNYFDANRTSPVHSTSSSSSMPLSRSPVSQSPPPAANDTTSFVRTVRVHNPYF